MKLIVQIPSLNEEATLPAALADIPRAIEGIDVVEVLVIDDGSKDRTLEVARASGADHVVRFTRQKGLASAFTAGLDASLRLGADIIVNTDADGQYPGRDIPRLIAPILRGEADMTIGDRRVRDVEHFSWTKRRLQSLGSWVVRKVSGTDVPDTTSGFRAFSREAALRLNVVSEFTYTLETIIQAGKKRLAIAHLDVEPQRTRPSRLFGSTYDYVKRQVATIIRIYAMYEPFKVFMSVGSILFTAGFLLGLRYAYFWWMGEIRGHIQSAILSVLLLILGFQTIQWGLMADLIASNRKLIEDALYRIRRAESEKTLPPKSEPDAALNAGPKNVNEAPRG
jgi:glycosyltransferase involved in cell wall biosynthesis